MVGPGLALASALVYGLVDYAGGILSRRVGFATVSLLGQVGGLVVAIVLSLVFPAEAVRPTDLLWGVLSGMGSAVTMLFLNRGISHGALSVVVPVSAVTGVALSVVCGVAFLGDRPGVLAWAGIVLVLPSLWGVTRGRLAGTAEPGGDGIGDGLLASCGVAVQYVALGMVAAGSGLWPVAVGRAAAVLVLLPVVHRMRPPRLVIGDQLRAAVIGGGAALGLVLYLLATRQEMLAVAVAVASLYPAVPVVLGLVVQREPLRRPQAIGLVGAMAAVVLLSVG